MHRGFGQVFHQTLTPINDTEMKQLYQLMARPLALEEGKQNAQRAKHQAWHMAAQQQGAPGHQPAQIHQEVPVDELKKQIEVSQQKIAELQSQMALTKMQIAAPAYVQMPLDSQTHIASRPLQHAAAPGNSSEAIMMNRPSRTIK